MDSKKFFMKIREIISEEIQYALENNEKNNVKISQKKALNHGIDLLNKVSENKNVKPKPKNTKYSSINDLLEETRKSLQESTMDYVEDDDTMYFDSNSVQGFAGTNTDAAIPNGYASNQIPQDVMSALTKDYSALMKKIDEKKGG